MVELCAIERNDEKSITSDLFYKYINLNQPVLFSNYKCDANEKWSVDYLKQVIGEQHKVDVNMCTFGSMSKDIVSMKFTDYLTQCYNDEFQKVNSSGALVKKTDRPYLRNFAMLDDFPELKKDLKNDESIYNSSIHNLVIMGSFIGCKNSSTHLHKDTGDNLVTVITGKKFIVLIPPCDESKVVYSKDSRDIEIKYNDQDQGTPLQSHPAFSNVPKLYTTIIDAGESLFIPIGWLHYVHNIEFTISVSCWGKKMEM